MRTCEKNDGKKHRHRREDERGREGKQGEEEAHISAGGLPCT
jgi:hypothetical protein